MHDDDDRLLVEAQIGRPLRGTWMVAARCHLGVPMVIENHPRLDDGSPFPTLFWLTCPMLVKRVSKLEGAGGMEALNRELSRDARLRERLDGAIAALRARRDAFEVIEDSGGPPGGGPDRVKCLHAHTAQQLVESNNPIGARAVAAAGFPDCRVPCYRVT